MKYFYLSLIFTMSIAHATFSQNVLHTDSKFNPASHFESQDYLIQTIDNYANDGISTLRKMNAMRQELKAKSMSSRAPLKYLLDSVYRNSTQDNGITWDNSYKSIYSYYPNGKRKENISLRYDNNTWIYNSKTNYMLNAQNLEAGYVSQQWVSPGLWQNYQKLETTYNSNGLILLNTYSPWNNTTMEWINGFRYTSSYDAGNQLIEVVYENYDLISQKWVNNYRWNYFYDSNGKLTETIYQFYENGIWTTGWKYTPTYNAKGLLIEEYYSNWDVIENKYVPSEKANYSYNQFDLLEEEIYSNWVDSLMNYVIDYKSNYIYDQNNNLKVSYDYEINPDSTNLIVSEKDDYYFSLHDVTTKTANNTNNNIEIYPNPFHNTVQLNNISQDSKITLVDINGKIIYHAINEKILDLSALTSGVYFLEVVSDRTSSMHKIIKN